MPVTLHFSQGEEMKCIATNLSEGGMALRFDGALPKGSISKALFTLPETKVAMEPKGEIAWADGLGRAGLKFVDVPESSRDQLEKWILRRIENEAKSSR